MTLTRRELEVARLVCEGLTDQGIAVRLSIAKRTFEWHLEQIRSKLGFDNRAQIAAWVAVRGLAGSSSPAAAAQLHNLPSRATTGGSRTAVGRQQTLRAALD